MAKSKSVSVSNSPIESVKIHKPTGSAPASIGTVIASVPPGMPVVQAPASPPISASPPAPVVQPSAPPPAPQPPAAEQVLDAADAALAPATPPAASSAASSAAQPPPPAPLKAPGAPAARYRVKQTTTISLFGQIITLHADSIISTAGYGHAAMDRIKASNIALEQLPD